jgi:hypothetical protein
VNATRSGLPCIDNKLIKFSDYSCLPVHLDVSTMGNLINAAIQGIIEAHHDPIPISYPSMTSVEAPSHPRLPPVDIMNEQVGSRYSCEMTPVL